MPLVAAAGEVDVEVGVEVAMVQRRDVGGSAHSTSPRGGFAKNKQRPFARASWKFD